ncbi:hypothetical protein OOU_Y34scaffold00035g6 [Pyricularia oryzae Y34]|uniref:Uncharacterized protein n=1 Tax=Pyricularia oryzae (strain Y34) TaxID=1143189 RepID=A0AA97PAB4_PYRO3|nr:hypothetical protein OOU_Y34scaffold00035g6 [Pyricularia oryzae Y34]
MIDGWMTKTFGGKWEDHQNMFIGKIFRYYRKLLRKRSPPHVTPT